MNDWKQAHATAPVSRPEWERVPEGGAYAYWKVDYPEACEVWCDCKGDPMDDEAPTVYIDSNFRGQCSNCGKIYRAVFERHIEVMKDYPRKQEARNAGE
jgi:hypothetical protein